MEGRGAEREKKAIARTQRVLQRLNILVFHSYCHGLSHRASHAPSKATSRRSDVMRLRASSTRASVKVPAWTTFPTARPALTSSLPLSFSARTTFRWPRRAPDGLLRFVSVVFASAARIGDLIRILSACRQETNRATRALHGLTTTGERLPSCLVPFPNH